MKLEELITLLEARGDWGNFDVDVYPRTDGYQLRIRNIPDIEIPSEHRKILDKAMHQLWEKSYNIKDKGTATPEETALIEAMRQVERIFDRWGAGGAQKSSNKRLKEFDQVIYDLTEAYVALLKTALIEHIVKEREEVAIIIQRLNSAQTAEDYLAIARDYGTSS